MKSKKIFSKTFYLLNRNQKKNRPAGSPPEKEIPIP